MSINCYFCSTYCQKIFPLTAVPFIQIVTSFKMGVIINPRVAKNRSNNSSDETCVEENIMNLPERLKVLENLNVYFKTCNNCMIIIYHLLSKWELFKVYII